MIRTFLFFSFWRVFESAHKKRACAPFLLFSFSKISYELAFVCDSWIVALFHRLVSLVGAIEPHLNIRAKKFCVHRSHSFRHFSCDEQCLISRLEVEVTTMLNARSSVDGKFKPHDRFLSFLPFVDTIINHRIKLCKCFFQKFLSGWKGFVPSPYSHQSLLAIARKMKLTAATGTITNNGARRIAIADI